MVPRPAQIRIGPARRFRIGPGAHDDVPDRNEKYPRRDPVPENPRLSRILRMRQSHISIIGAPLDLGQDRRGVDMGPSAIRVANLNKRLTALGYQVEDQGNIPVAHREASSEGPAHARYLPQIAETCRRLGLAVEKAATQGK